MKERYLNIQISTTIEQISIQIYHL